MHEYLHDERVAPKFCAWFAIKSLERSDKRTGFTVHLTAKCNMRQTSFTNARNTVCGASHARTYGKAALLLEKRVGNLSRRGRDSWGQKRTCEETSQVLASGFITPPISTYRAVPWFYMATIVAYSWNYVQFATKGTLYNSWCKNSAE